MPHHHFLVQARTQATGLIGEAKVVRGPHTNLPRADTRQENVLQVEVWGGECGSKERIHKIPRENICSSREVVRIVALSKHVLWGVPLAADIMYGPCTTDQVPCQNLGSGKGGHGAKEIWHIDEDIIISLHDKLNRGTVLSDPLEHEHSFEGEVCV